MDGPFDFFFNVSLLSVFLQPQRSVILPPALLRHIWVQEKMKLSKKQLFRCKLRWASCTKLWQTPICIVRAAPQTRQSIAQVFQQLHHCMHSAFTGGVLLEYVTCMERCLPPQILWNQIRSSVLGNKSPFLSHDFCNSRAWILQQ